MSSGFIFDKDAEGKPIIYLAPFRSKYNKTGQLFKRIHGVSILVPANSTANLDFPIPYNICLFAGAEIFGTEIGDQVNFKLLDDAINTYSQAPVEQVGANYMLMQFGFGLFMPGGPYKNTSDYDAELYNGMIIRCEYTNNTNTDKTIYMNPEIHEVVTP